MAEQDNVYGVNCVGDDKSIGDMGRHGLSKY